MTFLNLLQTVGSRRLNDWIFQPAELGLKSVFVSGQAQPPRANRRLGEKAAASVLESGEYSPTHLVD